MLDLYLTPISKSDKIIKTGEFFNLILRNNKLKILPDENNVWKNDTNWNNSPNNYYSDSFNKWGNGYKSYGYFISNIFNLNEICLTVLDFKYISHLTSEYQSINIFISTSIDGEIFTDFEILNTDKKILRYYKIKIEFINNSNTFMYLQEI